MVEDCTTPSKEVINKKGDTLSIDIYKPRIVLLIEAFGEINLKFPDLFLVIAGPYSKNLKLLSKLKLRIIIQKLKIFL